MLGYTRVLETHEEHAVLKGGTAYLVWVSLGNRALRRIVLSFIATVVKRFFVDQFVFRLKLGLRSRGANIEVPALKTIEHQLDSLVPIRYETVEVYLGFIQLWISSLSYLRRRLGPAFDADIIDFLVGLRRCYLDASSVYGRGLTTTRRPERAPSPRFAFIYAVDPHLFCVPSLHVLVVCYTYKRLEALLRARGDLERFSLELDAVRAKALAITESILYVRQHSVNCIPTSLAMLGVIEPSYDESESKRFLSELFVDEEAMHSLDRARIVDYMTSLYERIARSGPDACYDAIADFIAAYMEIA
ncbi:MAG: hypothetical protein RBT62_05160 [Spirochaetia bacterium]|jgi:hypothetical protein|nr:hypothetical protein [Spirochaetia bacterium]